MCYPIQIQCSNCKVDMGTKPGGKKPGEVTHSYCPICHAAIMDDIKKESQRPIRTKKSA